MKHYKFTDANTRFPQDIEIIHFGNLGEYYFVASETDLKDYEAFILVLELPEGIEIKKSLSEEEKAALGVIPLETYLNELRKVKYAEIEAKRKELQYANVPFNATELYATIGARSNLLNAYYLSKDTVETVVQWLDVNDNLITLTIEELLSIIQTLRSRDQTLYYTEAQMKKTLQSCTTADEIRKFEINFPV
jgi:hypothetical protein